LRQSGFNFYPNHLRSLPLYELCEEIIRIFALDEGPYNPYIQFFLEFVNRQTAGESIQLPDLLETWEEKKNQLSVVVPEGINAIRIMTIHKAKGLEFPVVIWPFATESLKSTRDQLWIEPHHPALMGLPVALVPTSKELGDIGYGDIYDVERNKSLLDMINLIYVAFTRPVERLYVLTKDMGGAKPDNLSLPVLLNEYLLQDPEKWAKDGLTFSNGNPDVQRSIIEDKLEPAPGIGEFISASWHDRIQVARRAPDTWTAGQAADSQAWGTLVHDCLARINTPVDLEAILEKVKEESQLPAESVEKLRKQVSSVIQHEQLCNYFISDMEVKPEASILLPEGSLLRPDRVILKENEAVILEFKTGLPEDKHDKQLISYAEALEKMGFEKVMRLLVYINEQVIVKMI